MTGLGPILRAIRMGGHYRSSTGQDDKSNPSATRQLTLWTPTALVTLLLIAAGCSTGAGEYTPAGIGFVLAAVIIAIGGVALSGRWGGLPVPSRLWVVVACVCAALNGMPALLTSNVAIGAAAIVFLVASVLALCLLPLRGHTWIAAELGVGANIVLAAAKWHWGKAGMDVFWFTQGATAQLLAGHNPYAAVYRTITPNLPTAHFPYGPGVLMWTTAFRALGDVRLGNLVAMIAIYVGILLLADRSGGARHAGRCLGLMLATPFAATMIVNAWPEVYPVVGIVWWLVWREKRPRWSICALGVGLAAVPTAAPLLVLPWLWWRRPRWEISLAALLALVLALPFALWAGPRAFVADTIGVQVGLGLRPDALSLNGLLLHLGAAALPGAFGVVLVIVVLVALATRGQRDWGSALGLGAGVTLVAFFLAKWAFFDYYFIVVVGLILALSVGGGTARDAHGVGELGVRKSAPVAR